MDTMHVTICMVSDRAINCKLYCIIYAWIALKSLVFSLQCTISLLAGVGKYSWYVNNLQDLPYDFPSDFLLFHHCSNADLACYRSSVAIYDNVWWVQTCSIVWHWAHIMLSFLLFQCHIVTRIKNVSEMIRVRSNRYSLNNSLVICLHISNDFLHIVKSTAPTTSPPNGNVSIVHGLCCISNSEEE